MNPKPLTAKQLGQRIKKRRLQLKMTQYRLTTDAGLYAGSVKCFETGKWFPNLPTLLALAQALGVKPGYFLD